jgi:hypothetical protein
MLKAWLAKLGLAVGSIALVLALGEGIFRVLDLRGYHDARWEIGQKFQPGARFRHEYSSNPRGYFGPNNEVEYQLNDAGFRGRDATRRKPPGTRRLVLLGDSFAFGEGVRLEDTFATQLESLLARPGRPVEVVNISVGGWGTAEEIAHLESVGVQYAPDLVLVIFVLNDAAYAGGLDLWQEFVAQYQDYALKDSYLFSYLFARIARATLARSYIEDLVGRSEQDIAKWNDAFSELLRGKHLAKAAGAEFSVAIFPFLYALDQSYPFRGLHERVADFCEENDIAVVDLFSAFAGRDYAELWVHPSDQHPNEEGHAIAADALAAFIQERALLRDSKP